MRIAFYSIATIITAMIGYTVLNGEDLVTENGKVDARKLPFDKATSKIAFETATFGIG